MPAYLMALSSKVQGNGGDYAQLTAQNAAARGRAQPTISVLKPGLYRIIEKERTQ
jgi:hypothetical protein